MTKEMRERIEKGIREGELLKDIAHAIDKDPTTISKEVLKRRSDAVPVSAYSNFSSCCQCKKHRECNVKNACEIQGCAKYYQSCIRIIVTDDLLFNDQKSWGKKMKIKGLGNQSLV